MLTGAIWILLSYKKNESRWIIECILHYSSIPEIFDLYIKRKKSKITRVTDPSKWNAYKQIQPPLSEIDAWSFEVEPDLFSELVFLKAKKKQQQLQRRPLSMRRKDEPLPQEGLWYRFEQWSSCLHYWNYKVSVQSFHRSFSRPCLWEGEGRQVFNLMASGSWGLSKTALEKQVWFYTLTA